MHGYGLLAPSFHLSIFPHHQRVANSDSVQRSVCMIVMGQKFISRGEHSEQITDDQGRGRTARGEGIDNSSMAAAEKESQFREVRASGANSC